MDDTVPDLKDQKEAQVVWRLFLDLSIKLTR